MNKKSCGWKIFFEVIFCSPKDSQLLAPWPSVKCISYIGKNPLQTKIKYVKIWNMFSFWWEGAKWTLARNNLSALWVGNCNCFILIFIMNASSSSSWQQPEQRIDSCFATVWLSSILLLQVLGSFWNCFLDCLPKKSAFEWFITNLELQVSRAQSSVPPLHGEQLNKYLNFKRR